MPLLGNLKLTLLLDAYIEISGASVFWPAEDGEWQPSLGFPPAPLLTLPATALLIDDGHELTLVDTGFGSDENPERDTSIIKSLSEIGVQTEQISRVILTHAHGDHCMGATTKSGSAWQPTYSGAEYIMQRNEYAFGEAAQDPVWRTRIAPLHEAGQLRLIAGRTQLDAYLTCWPMPGHTIGHQCVLMESQGEKALHLGDLAVVRHSFARDNWGPDWAWSREQDSDNRKRVVRWAAEEHAILVIGHDPEMSFARVTLDDSGVPQFEPAWPV